MAAPAGWYDDPEMVNTRRYWDGAQWTEHRQETAVAAPPVATQTVYVVENEYPSTPVVIAGSAFAILMPIIGFFFGLALLGKRGNEGLVILVTSVVCFFIWFWILAW